MTSAFSSFKFGQRRRNKDEVGKPPWLWKIRSSETFIITTIAIAIFTDIFLYACVVPVMPFALQARIHVPASDIQHHVSVLLAVYGAALAAGSPICGVFSDRMPNRRLPLLIGLVILGGATVLLCLATSFAMMLAARAFQGLSAAVVWTVGLALLADTVGEGRIGMALGYVSISMSAGVLVAPMIGGIVYAKSGYYSVFYICFGMILLDIILRLALIEKKVARKWLDSQPVDGSTPVAPAEDGEKVVAVSPNEAAILAEGETRAPVRQARPQSLVKRMLEPFRAVGLLLSSRRLLAALLGSFVGAILLMSWDATLPLHVNKLFGWSSLGGGLIFLPLIIPTLIAPVAGMWADKKGPRWPAVCGFLLLVPPVILLRFVDHGGIKQVVLLCALLAIVGFAVTFAYVPLEAEIVYVVKLKEKSHPQAFGGRGAYATAYGLFNTAFAGGMLVGPIWGGFVNQGAGWGTMCWSLGLLSFFAAVMSFLFVGGGAFEKRRGEDEEANSGPTT